MAGVFVLGKTRQCWRDWSVRKVCQSYSVRDDRRCKEPVVTGDKRWLAACLLLLLPAVCFDHCHDKMSQL